MHITAIASQPTPDTRQKIATDQMEAMFMKEFIKPLETSGVSDAGQGAAQYASFLTDQYAEILSEKLNLNLFNTVMGAKHAQ